MILAVLKKQQFKDNGSDKRKSSISKCQRFDVNDNKERESLEKYENKTEGKTYVIYLFIPNPPYFRKESNYMTDLDERIKSLNHLV